MLRDLHIEKMKVAAFTLLLMLLAYPSRVVAEQLDFWHDEFFEMAVPKEWTVRRTNEDANSWTYEIAKEGTKLFEALVVRGGPRFIDCQCARPQFYRHTTDPVYETWALEIQLGERNFITWKVATDEMRLDIHGNADDAGIVLLREIIYSARPRSTKP